MTHFNKFSFIVLSILITGCRFSTETIESHKTPSENEVRDTINKVMNSWHRAATDADFETYFNHMANDGVFLGTDASENWQNKEFRDFSKPYFDKGKAWSFNPLERNIYVDSTKTSVWFDELLQTQMGICRGSGILKMEDNQWKIKHYVLSLAIPNEKVSEVVGLKKEWDSTFVKNVKAGSKSVY